MRGVAAVVGIVILTTLAGCGGKEISAVVIVNAAQVRTEAAKTARVRVALSFAGETLQTEGVADLAHNQATYTVKVPGIGTFSAIQSGTVLYEKADGSAVLPGSKPWIKFDYAVELKKLIGIDPDRVSESMSSDPGSALTYLEGASSDIHKVGSDTLHGANATHYHGTLDLALAATHVKDQTARSGLRRTAKLLGVTTFPVDVWIDDGGRLRQMKYSLDTAKFALPDSAAPAGVETYTFEFFDFGVAFVMPPLPSPDQVEDIAKDIANVPSPLAPTPPSSGLPLASVIGAPPAGFARWNAPIIEAGPIEPSKFVQLLGVNVDVDPAPFVGGYHDTFANPTDFDTYDVGVFAFDSASSAARFDRDLVAALEASGVYATTDTELPAAWDWNSTKADSAGAYNHVVVARKGDRVMVIGDSNITPGTHQPAVARIARQQYSRL